MTAAESDDGATKAIVSTLIAQRERFLAFVEARVGNRADAEDLLQAAFLRGAFAANDVRDGESVVAWFYRILRNAIIDHYRHRGAEQRSLDKMKSELPDDAAEAPAEVRESVCACVRELLPTLRPDLAEILRRVDVDDRPVHAVADEQGITHENARVRLHRARRALREQVQATCGACADHGCLDCTCRHAPRGQHPQL